MTVLTDKEESLLEKQVIAIRDIDYGAFKITKNSIGTIVDFGKSSGDPGILWNNNKLSIAVFNVDIKLLDQ